MNPRKKKVESLKRIFRGRKQDHGTKRAIRGRSREEHNIREWKLSRKRRLDFRRGAEE